MKKMIFAIVVLGVLGYGIFWIYRSYIAPRETRACVKLGQLCDSEMSSEALERCESLLKRLTATSGPKKLDQAVSCIMDSESCSGGLGCVVGTGLGAFTEFFKGVSTSAGSR